MSAEPVVNGVGSAEEQQTENVDDLNAKKTVKYDSGAADLEKVTDYAEEKEVISTDDISGVIFNFTINFDELLIMLLPLEQAMTIIGDRRLKEAADKIAKEKELQKVSIKKSDVELIVSIIVHKYVCVVVRKYKLI